ncbi:thymidylate synthase [Candidatus Dojkabacteria bacterium]|nr:thymidylate synthase [Candidatus Dojkabacteria bacterium]
MRQYLDFLRHILQKGRSKDDRSGFGLKSIFGYQMRFDFRNGFPIVTTKKMPIKTMTHELLWFISGSTNIKYLQENGIHYWDDFADFRGDLGPIYGHQWRKWPDLKGGHIDQLANVIEEIKTVPYSKAMLVSAWNPAQKKEMRLPPCHAFFQFNVNKEKLRCQLYQRSSDAFLGLPFNISQYALLTMMVAQVTGLEARELIVTIGDGHLYKNHLEAATEQLKRKPKELPEMKINKKIKNIDDFRINDFELINYEPHPHIKAPLVLL